jgi:hypothetical protein
VIADESFVQERQASPPPDARTAGFRLAGARLQVDSDDPGLIQELASVLGSPAAAGEQSPDVSASVRVSADPAFGRMTLSMPRAEQLAPTDLLLAASSPDFPFERLESTASRVVLALRGEREPVLEAEGREVRFAVRPGWRKAVSLLLLQRLMRSRQDAIFFHAGSVAVDGRGAMVVGVKGSGKSTLVMALAARGHGLLGDENACYLPGTGQLFPCRRPVGVKPGPRARAVEARLCALGRFPERDGMMRVPAEELFPGPEPAAVPLRAVVFLGPREALPRLNALVPGRPELARLQPVGASLLDVPASRRVFEMARLLAGARVYELLAGSPDETADALESALAAA